VGVSIEGFGKVEGALRHRPRVGNPGAGPKIAQARFRGKARAEIRFETKKPRTKRMGRKGG
jgi:hypothetical protein